MLADSIVNQDNPPPTDTGQETVTMNSTLVDDFEDLSGWAAVPAGQARLQLSPERGPHGGAIRLDSDFWIRLV